MKNRFRFLGIVAAVAIIGLSMAACDTGGGNLVGNGGGFNIGDFIPIPEGNPTVSVTITGIPQQYRGMVGMLQIWCEEQYISALGIPRGFTAATTVFDLASVEWSVYYDETYTWLGSALEGSFNVIFMMANPEDFDQDGDVSSFLVFAAEGVNLSGNNTSITFLPAFAFLGANPCDCWPTCDCGDCICDAWCECP